MAFVGKSSRHGFSEDDYLGLLARSPEILFQDDSYMKHLRRNATKFVLNMYSIMCYELLFRILLRTRQLHVIRWQMLEPFLDKIKKNAHYRWVRLSCHVYCVYIIVVNLILICKNVKMILQHFGGMMTVISHYLWE